MHARTGTLDVSPDSIDEVVGRVRDEQLPRYREQEGYKGFTILADRGSGKVVGISFWESEQALAASDELGQAARAEAAEVGGMSGEPQVAVFEVLLDDMA